MTSCARATLAALAVALLTAAGSAADTAPPPRPAANSTAKPTIADRLAKRVDVEPFAGTLNEALDRLRTAHHLPLVVDPTMRRPTGEGEPRQDAGDLPVHLPRLTNVRTDTVLRLLGEQVNGMFLARPDGVALVDAGYARYETGLAGLGRGWDEEPASFLPASERAKAEPLTRRSLVTADFKGRPLAEVVDAIVDATGANVVIAPAVAEEANRVLTVRFANARVDVAVRTLCELADLGVIEDENVLVITTRERADARAAADRAKRRAQLEDGGAFAGGLGAAAAAPTADDLARLREQVELLRKQLDEATKPAKK